MFVHHTPILGSRCRAARPSCAVGLATCVWLIGLMWCNFASALSGDVPLGELRHSAWGANEGAPAGGARALVQANDGFLWMAGFNGVFRFDGLAFERVDLPRSERLASMAVFSLFAPRSGGVWLGFTFGGAGLLKEGQLTVHTAADGLPPGSALSFAEDLDHTLWAATNKGLARLEGSRWRVVGADWGLPPTAMQSLIVDSQGTLWVTAPGRAFTLSRGSGTFQEIKVPLSDFVSIAESPTGVQGQLRLHTARLCCHATHRPCKGADALDVNAAVRSSDHLRLCRSIAPLDQVPPCGGQDTERLAALEHFLDAWLRVTLPSGQQLRFVRFDDGFRVPTHHVLP
jgi:hypothetical protein